MTSQLIVTHRTKWKINKNIEKENMSIKSEKPSASPTEKAVWRKFKI